VSGVLNRARLEGTIAGEKIRFERHDDWVNLGLESHLEFREHSWVDIVHEAGHDIVRLVAMIEIQRVADLVCISVRCPVSGWDILKEAAIEYGRAADSLVFVFSRLIPPER
jgi:hypothetical protein